MSTTVITRPEFSYPPEYRERRYTLRVKDSKSFYALRAPAASFLPVRVVNSKRRYISLAVHEENGTDALLLESKTTSKMISVNDLAEKYGGTIQEVFQFDIDSDVFAPDAFSDPGSNDASLHDVLQLIKADEAQRTFCGDDVVIAIVDSGVNGQRHEFDGRHAGQWQLEKEADKAWTDWLGHGTMCATVAAANTANGGEFVGVAPHAQVVACRTYFKDDELANCYDYLITMAQSGKHVVISNSFGIESGAPPVEQFLDFTGALDDALSAGILVIFAAGNYHQLTDPPRSACAPTSVWGFKCRDDVLTVGTCKLDGTMWEYSSRGPGERAGKPGMSQKPDVIAPTPENGKILVGDTVLSLRQGWGTSGACPQVAGLAALLWSKKPAATAADIANAIRCSADSIGLDRNCQGAGMINCHRALTMI